MAGWLPTLWGRDDRDPFTEMRRDMERVFQDFSRRLPSVGLTSVALSPDVDIREKDGRLEVTAELPGVEEKDVSVTFENGMLTISGEKRTEKEEKDEHHYVSERSYGAFRRSFSLPWDVDPATIEAHFEKGVLKVTVPKSEPAKPAAHKIAVKSKK